MEQLIRKLLVAAALALLTVSSAIPAERLRVVDGDTISIDGMPIRLLQIDTPETWSPRCQQELELGMAATKRLEELLDGHEVTYQATGYDRFGRVLARVYADGVDVSEVLLREGHALPYKPGQKAKAERLVKWCPTGK